ncbi:hypothetical protein JCM6882_003249 [Rhodosporidiobolus microsporus]
MHSFFTTGFEPLRALIVDLLAEDGVHSLLPLLGVNREWRRLAVKGTLQVYKNTLSNMTERSKKAWLPEKEQDGEFILCLPCGICWMVCAYKETDPRMVRTSFKKYLVSPLPLFLDAFDPVTMVCPFKPGKNAGDIQYELRCNEQHHEYPDIPANFEFHPSAWLRPSISDTPTSLNGLEVAARPDRHPPIGIHCLFPDNLSQREKDRRDGGGRAVSQNEELDECSVTVVKDKPLRPGSDWTISYRTARFDTPAEKRDLGVDVPALLMIHKLEVPFIDLFEPRESFVDPCYSEM